MTNCTRKVDFVVVNETDKTIKKFLIDADIRGRRELLIEPHSKSDKVFLALKKRCICVSQPEIWYQLEGYVDNTGKYINQVIIEYIPVKELSTSKTNSFVIISDTSSGRKSKVFRVEIRK